MAVWSITKKNEIVHHKRFDGKFFHPKSAALHKQKANLSSNETIRN